MNKKRTESENRTRERLIEKIEAITGTLESVPYNEISTNDLNKILLHLPL